MPPGKAAQGAGGKARAGRKGCCLQQIPLFPHYKYKQQKKGVRGLVLVMQKGKAEQAQPGPRVLQQNVEGSTHEQDPEPSKAGFGCWACLDAKLHRGLFWCLPFETLALRHWFHKVFELPSWRSLDFLKCPEQISKNHALHVSLAWAPDMTHYSKKLQVQIWLWPKEDRIEGVVRE